MRADAELVEAASALLARLPGCNWCDPSTGRACRRPAYHRDTIGRGRYCREHGERAGREGLQPIPWAGSARRLFDLIERHYKLTPVASDVLKSMNTAGAGGLLLRVPNTMFWTTRDTPLDAAGKPVWWTSTQLVRALTEKGYLRVPRSKLAKLTSPRGMLLRELTDQGRRIARQLERLDRAAEQ